MLSILSIISALENLIAKLALCFHMARCQQQNARFCSRCVGRCRGGGNSDFSGFLQDFRQNEVNFERESGRPPAEPVTQALAQ